ncbi:MAG: ABC transporter ATP-binding protein [Solirubrobacteraceae bacterium]|jgi:putative ABC transport system ATP-binding protein
MAQETPVQASAPAPELKESVYELTAVSKVYGSGNTMVRALDEIDMTVAPGEFVAIIGASGSGKTTLLQLLGALDRPTSGRILLGGQDLTKLGERELSRLRREEIGFVFQQFNLIPTLTAAGNIEAALATGDGSARQNGDRVAELLDVVGLTGRGHHLPSQLSGGEQQRVAIARSLANDPSVLLADEPTGNLDTTTGEELLAELERLVAERHLTLVLITHEPAIAAAAQRTIRLQDGRIVDEPVAAKPRRTRRKPA